MRSEDFEFLAWCLDAQKSGLIQFHERHWAGPLTRLKSLRYYYCQIPSQEGDTFYFGLGVDSDTKMAIIKAASEAIERYILRSLKITNSNGCATHLTSQMAVENATQELLERDAFLCHFYTQRSLKEINTKDFLSSNDMDELRSLGLTYRLFEAKSNGLNVSLSLYTGETFSKFRFGGIIGMGISDDPHHAHFKSLIEASRFIDSLLKDDIYRPLSLFEFNHLKKITVNEHACLGMDSEYFNQVGVPMFQEKAFSGHLEVDSTKFLKKIVTAEEVGLKGCPLIFAQVSHPDVQDLHFGRFQESHWNVKRLEQFVGGKIPLLRQPHFLA